MHLLPKPEAAGRLRRIQERIAKMELDCLFILQNADQYYFAGSVEVGMVCITGGGEPLYLVQKSATRARLESPWERIVPISSLRKLPDILSGEGLRQPRRVGLELDVLPAQYYLRFRELFPEAEIVDASDAIRRTRMIKSAYEIDRVKGAALMLRKAFLNVPDWAQAGATELEVSARLESFLRLQGHQGITRMRGFNFEIGYGTVSGGPAACYPTCFPGPVGFIGLYPAIPNGGSLRRLAADESLMIDVCGGYGGYIADKTRTFAIGELGKDMRDAHAFTLELIREIEALLKPGTPCSRIYQHTLDRVKESPYSETFMGVGDSRVRFVGHGVGLELDELPVLAAGVEDPLEPGMTIAIEPKIFFPEKGGVGIENTYLITDSGFETLTPFEEEILDPARR